MLEIEMKRILEDVQFRLDKIEETLAFLKSLENPEDHFLKIEAKLVELEEDINNLSLPANKEEKS